ncbi:hypothetical protein EKO27_g8190 [Xylaria grammica]|uniref:Uncharacterized protein n=1 Tax=Xylaria grammica TaxID=363999 RepID=A0A439CXJ5_9PEZI|nr:hypothetical protein EKO27_g8190 [Xylaria grammica]
MLLGYEADRTYSSPSGETALKLAEENGHEQILGFLQRFSICYGLGQGLALWVLDWSGQSDSVYIAVGSPEPSCFPSFFPTEELSDHHILLSMRILEAAAEGRVAEIVLLDRLGANVNTAYMFRDSKTPSVPIVFAAAKSDELVIVARLRSGAEVDRPGQDGMTALCMAARTVT